MPRRMRLIADLHNAALLPLWMGVPGTMALLKQFDVILVHNKDVQVLALEAGITRDRLLVLEDRVPDFAPKNSPRSIGRPALVMPCSFSPDEPIELVLDVARSLPDVDFIFTGDLQRIKRLRHPKELPENAVFTGFLEIDEFNDAILSSQGVLGLTTRDGIQLSAASEALGAGKPMILSDTPLLRSLFGPAALFTENSFEPLRAACLQAINHHAAHESATIALRSAPERLGRWLAQAESVKAILRA
jgi:glycosyltransferase involved in cell wall biosynthesis